MKLHPYQELAVQHIIDHPACALLMDMGLGKTGSTLAALDALMHDYFVVSPGTVLIIAPKKVAESVWAAEIAKWGFPLTISVILGTKKQRVAAMAAKVDIYITSRDFVDWIVEHWGKSWPYSTIILDELSSFKNPGAVRFRQLRKVRPLCRRVIGLTGTPAPNGLMDIWSQLYLLDRGERLEKTLGDYRRKYFTPGATDGGYVVFNWHLQKGAAEKIYEKIGDICISMKAADYLQLPERLDIIETVTLGPAAEELMTRMESELVLDMDPGLLVAETAAALSGKLVQMASGAVYTTVEPGQPREWVHIHDDKLDALEELLEALAVSGENALVAYWHGHMLERLKKRFPKARELKTSQDITDWNAGKIPILLTQPASSGMGLNLQAGGNVIIWTENTWALEVYLQFNARLHRQGQGKPVRIYHLVTKDTIDEDIIAALGQKEVTQDKLMHAVKVRLGLED